MRIGRTDATGYRGREFDTPAGTRHVAIPKLRQLSHFPEWLWKRRKACRAGTDQHALAEKLPNVAEHLETARADILRLHRVPQGNLAPDLVNNPNERLNREIRHRTDVVGIFPARLSIIRLVGAVWPEQHDEWAEGRRYLGLDVLARAQAVEPLAAAAVGGHGGDARVRVERFDRSSTSVRGNTPRSASG